MVVTLYNWFFIPQIETFFVESQSWNINLKHARNVAFIWQTMEQEVGPFAQIVVFR
jgi:hypothetical protein